MSVTTLRNTFSYLEAAKLLDMSNAKLIQLLRRHKYIKPVGLMPNQYYLDKNYFVTINKSIDIPTYGKLARTESYLTKTGLLAFVHKMNFPDESTEESDDGELFPN